MAQVAVKPVDRVNARFLNADAIVLGFQIAGQTEVFAIKPDQLNDLIGALIIASLNPVLTAKRTPPPSSNGGVEKVLTFPLERIAASHAPTKGTVSIVMTLPTGFRAAFEMSPKEALALSHDLQASAGKAQVPKSTAKH